MGNSLAHSLANFFMVTLENTLFNKENENNYCRYVDDVFCMFRKGVMFSYFYNRLHTVHKPITFTYELGEMNSHF